MSDDTGNLIEMVEFRAVAPKADLRGLDEALRKLQGLDTALLTVQNRLAGLSTGSAFKLTAAQFSAKIPTKDIKDVRKLAKVWGFPDVKDVQNVAREVETELQKSIQRIQNKLANTPVSPRGSTRARDALRQQIKDLQAQSLFTSPSAEAFKNPTRAGQFAEMYAKRALADEANARKAIAQMLGGGGGQAVPVPAPIPMRPPPAGDGARGVPGGAPTAREARALPEAAKAAAKASSKFHDELQKIKLELAENLNTADLGSISAAHAKAAAQVRALVEGDEEGKIKQRTKDKALQYAAERETAGNKAGQAALAQAGQNTFNIRKKLNAAEQAGQKEKAKQLQAELDAENERIAGLKKLNQVFYQPQAKQQQQRQQRAQRAAALAAEQQQAEAQRLAQHNIVQQQWKQFMATPGAEETARSGRMTLGANGQWTRLQEAQRRLPDGRIETFRADIGETAKFKRGFEKAPTKHDRLGAALSGLNMRDMAANLIKVSSWAAAVTVLYKSLELAEYSLARLEKTGMAMAHLGVVFRGVGGSAQDLTADTIKLAAAQGRSTDEAMESAVEWARLGGDRAAVNEEVRVSAIAANIADISMLETTKQLSALMHIYHLQASDLNGVLGELTNTSLKYNVTLDEMFIGLDRSAAAAKVAGVGLAELQAMIGVVVGGTGQTGSMTGNSIKYILQELNKPDVQKQLRGFGVEPLTDKLEQKPAGQMLAELHGVYGTMGRREQGALSGLLGGRFNAARVPILLENYPHVLQLAIDAQLNLNKAQEANVSILDTLKAQLAGLKAAWDKLVLDTNVMPGLVKLTRMGKNILSDIDSNWGGSPKSDRQKQQEIQAFLSGGSGAGRFLRATGNTIAGGWGMDTGPGLGDVYNYAHLSPEELGQFQVDPLEKLRGRVEAHKLRRTAYGMASATLANGTMTAENANVFGAIMNQAGGNGAGFLGAMGSGNKAAAKKILDEATVRELAVTQADNAKLAALNTARLGKDTKDREVLLARQSAAEQQHAGGGAQYQAEIDQKTKLIEADTKALNENQAAEEALGGELETVMATQQKYISLLKMQGDVMERISKMSSLVKANTPLQELDQQAAAAKSQLDYLKAQHDAVDSNPDYTAAEGVTVKGKILEEIKKAQAAYDAAGATRYNPMDPTGNGKANPFSTFNRSLAQREGGIESGVRAVSREASGQKYGYNETEKLLRERAYLQEKINSLGQESNRSAEQEGEYREAVNRSFENSLSLRQRQMDIEREIKQLAIDQNKEFQRAFFGAGPAEMLQKLAAFRMPSTMSQGAFFGMSPALRGDYGMLNPQFNPEMMRLRHEQAQNHAAVGALPGFASGGYTGDGNPGDVAGVVHKGEYVVPANIWKSAFAGPGAFDRNAFPNAFQPPPAMDSSTKAVADAATAAARAARPPEPNPDDAPPSTPEAWAAHDKAARDARWDAVNQKFGGNNPTTPAGWAAHDRAERDKSWEALNRKFGGNNPTTPEGWAAKDKATRDAAWERLNQKHGGHSPTTAAGWAAQDSAQRKAAFDAEYGGDRWRDIDKPRSNIDPATGMPYKSHTGTHGATQHPTNAQHPMGHPATPQPVRPGTYSPHAPGAHSAGSGASDAPSALVEVANRIRTAGASVAAALDAVAAKLNAFARGAMQMPQNAQAGGLGGGRGFTK